LKKAPEFLLDFLENNTQMEETTTEEPLVVLSTFQNELSGLEERYQKIAVQLHALAEKESEGANSTLQHVILLESETEDVSVRPYFRSSLEEQK
jgi:hypothetical protein